MQDGTEISGTRQFSKPDCSMHRNNGSNNLSECQKKKNEADRNSTMGIIGHFIPNCEADGTFSATQCHGSTGHCWCAMQDGTEISGTRNQFPKPDCSKHRNIGYMKSKPGDPLP